MTQPSSTPQLALNVAAIDYPKSVVVAYAEEFNSTDEIPAIRKRYCGTHFVRRFEKSRVLVLPLRADSPALSTPVKVDLSSASLWLIAALIRESLLNYLFSIDRKIIGLKPITFIDTKTDLLQQANQSKPKNDIISVRPAIAIDVRVFEFDTGAPFVGSALTVRVVKSIDAPCSALLAKGMNLSGLYVGPKLPDRDSRIVARLMTCGRVSRVEADYLVLDDARKGLEQIATKEAFVDPGPEAMKRVFELEFGAEAVAIRTKCSRSSEFAVFSFDRENR